MLASSSLLSKPDTGKVSTSVESGPGSVEDSCRQSQGNVPLERKWQSFWRRVLDRIGVDDAVGFAVVSKIWQLLTGPITQFLLVVRFTPALQDYYYAFNNLLGLLVFVELGLHIVLINVSSHEWAQLRLRDGRIAGDREAKSRLISLGRMMFLWYGILAMIFSVGASLAGIVFFRESAALTAELNPLRAQVQWVYPWIVLVILNGLQLPLLPMTAILEGCHQIAVVNRIRCFQAVIGTMVVWLAISSGSGLWALVGSAAVRLVGEGYLIGVRYRAFFEEFLCPADSSRIGWREEILPLQWRIAVQGVLLWLANQMPLLLIFTERPEGEAARLGMTWTILTAFQGGALAWIETRRPVFGTLVAEKNYVELDRLFFRLTRMSMFIMTLVTTFFCVAVWWMGSRSEGLFVRISERLLPLDATLLFSAAMVLIQFALCTNLYVRAHKRDPFLLASIASSLTVAGAQLWLGTLYGSTGIGLGYLLGIGCVQVPLWTLIWIQTRKEWHQIEAKHA